MAVMDRSAAFRQAKSEFETAKAALDDLKVQLDSITGYIYLQVLRQTRRKTDEGLAQLFTEAGVLTPDRDLAACKQGWHKLVPVGETWKAVGRLMDRLAGIDNQTRFFIKRETWETIRGLEADLAKARRAHNDAFAVYRALRDERNREWKARQGDREERQARQAQNEVEAALVVPAVLSRLDHPVRNRGKGRRRQKGAAAQGEGKTSKTETGRKGNKGNARHEMLS